jgi:DegV family protein with EDD domain
MILEESQIEIGVFMKIVTDSGTNVFLSPQICEQLGIHVVPLSVTLDGKTYREGLDVSNDDFYHMLEASKDLPTTSQPSAGSFAEVYREIAKKDPDILSIHISSGLSGTAGSARAGAAMVPEAHVTVVDTKTLSVPAGWQVESAARAVKAGWPLEKILAYISSIGAATEVVYTLKELKYLIHGGRISHMKGLIASLLNIKPIIGVELAGGTYVQRGQTRSFEKAIEYIGDYAAKKFKVGTPLRAQVVHASNPEGAFKLMDEFNKHFKCTWLPVERLSLVLGAHTGSSMIGVAWAPADVFKLGELTA